MDHAAECGAAQLAGTAVFGRQRPERRLRSHRLPGLLLPLPGHATRQACVEVGVVADRYRFVDRRYVDGSGLFQGRHRGRKRATRFGRCLVPPRRMALGATRRRDRGAGLETRVWFSALRVGGLQRGHVALCAWAGITDPCIDRRELQSLDRNLPVGEPVRARLFVRRAVFYPPVLACLDRFSRYPRRLHARKKMRLFRE